MRDKKILMAYFSLTLIQLLNLKWPKRLVKELQSLGLDVVVQDKDGNEIDMRQNFDDEETGFDMRDVAGTENVVQESELLNDYNIKDADAGFDDPSVLEDNNSGAEAPASSDEVDF